MKTRTVSLVSIMVMLALLVGGCQAAPTPPAAAPAPTSAPAQPATAAPVAAATTQTTASGQAAKPLKVAFVLPGLISDGSYNTQAYNSIQSVKTEPFIATVSYVEGKSAAADAVKAMRDYALEGYDVVWGQSGMYMASIQEVAPQFPKTVFISLDLPQENGPDNVWYASGQFEDAFYVAGALAGLMTKSNTIGMVGGRENPFYKACSMAFEEGAKSVNPNVKVLKAFTGDFNDPIKGREAATGQIENGADVLIHALNLGAVGVFKSAQEAPSKVWVIGKDIDQYELAPDVVLTSIMLNYATQMSRVLGRVAAGERTGVQPLSFKDGTAQFASDRGMIPADVVAKLDAIKKQVINGEVTFTTQHDLIKK